jgi:hypothetical protein
MKTIIYELNEVPKRLFEFFAAANPQSSFAHLRNHGALFETVAQDVGHLSPWITWPSLHRGVSNVEHKICELGQNLKDVNSEYPPIWTLLARHGVTVGMFGSLHSYPVPDYLDNYKFYVPDTFAAGPECFPEALTDFQSFNLSMVKRNGRNVSTGIAMDGAIQFLAAAPGLGLRGKTVVKLAGQIISERTNRSRVVRRRTSQSEIAFDFFLKQLVTKRPDASFFFTNHVASSMHRYWPSVFPEDYPEGKFDPKWLAQWGQEIPNAIHVANSQLTELLAFVNRHSGYRLIIVSSMGQAAVQDVTPIRKEVLITDIEKLLSYVGVRRDEWEPRLAMAPRVIVSLKSHSVLPKLEKLSGIRINGTKINFVPLETGEVRFDTNATDIESMSICDEAGRSIDPRVLGISNVDLQDAAGCYAYHVPDGILIEYGGGNKSADGITHWHRISALDVAPSILRSFGVAVPHHMRDDDKVFSAA